MGGVLKRPSFSPIIREMNDFSGALFDRAGDLVAQADYIPAQLGAMSLAVKSTARRWLGSLEPGDVFLANHPYMGCMHTPDLNVLMPLFIKGRLFGWTGATARRRATWTTTGSADRPPASTPSSPSAAIT